MHDLQRFIDRIWKRIYRDATTCKCETCEDVTRNWLIIDDYSHAQYLHCVSREYPIEYYSSKRKANS